MNKLQQIEKQESFRTYFAVKTKLDMIVATTYNYWNIITHIKHPTLRGREKDVKETLRYPDEIRVSKRQKRFFYFIKNLKKGIFV